MFQLPLESSIIPPTRRHVALSLCRIHRTAQKEMGLWQVWGDRTQDAIGFRRGIVV